LPTTLPTTLPKKKVPKSSHFSGENALKMGKNSRKLRENFLQDLVWICTKKRRFSRAEISTEFY